MNVIDCHQKKSTITCLTSNFIFLVTFSFHSQYAMSFNFPLTFHTLFVIIFSPLHNISFSSHSASLLVHLFFFFFSPPASWNVAVCHLLYYGTVPTVFHENNIRVGILPAVFILFFRFRMSGKSNSRRKESDSNQKQLLTIKYLTLFERSPFKDFVKAFNHHHYMLPVTDNHTC